MRESFKFEQKKKKKTDLNLLIRASDSCMQLKNRVQQGMRAPRRTTATKFALVWVTGSRQILEWSR